MHKKAVQQDRSERKRRGESYSGPYVESLSDARTPLAVFFRILLGDHTRSHLNTPSGAPCLMTAPRMLML